MSVVAIMKRCGDRHFAIVFYLELRAVSSYLIAVVAIMKRYRDVAIMKRYRDRHLQLSSTAFVSWNFYLSTCEH